MKLARIACAAAAMLLLAGCSSRQSIEELLRAPQPNEAQSAVQTALSNFLGEPLQLKYPRGGSEMAPLLFLDLDGDGADEAAALYVTEGGGTDVHLAILEDRDGSWEVVYELPGLGPEVAGVEEVPMLGTGTQLVVGYANTTLTDKYLAVYNYSSDSVTQLYSCAYTSYIAQDIYHDGGAELAVVLPVTQASVDIAVLRASEDGRIGVSQTLSLGEKFVSCDGLYVTESGGKTGLVADGASGSEERVTELFVVENNYLVRSEQQVPELSARSVQGLVPTDFDGAGAVDIPTLVTEADVPGYAHRFYYVTWRDMLGVPEWPQEQETPQEPASQPEQDPEAGAEMQAADGADPAGTEPDPAAQEPAGSEPEEPTQQPESGAQTPTALSQLDAAALEHTGVRFGVYDSANGYFLRLPLAWSGAVTIEDGVVPDSWRVRDAATNEMLVSVRLAGLDETVESQNYTLAGVTEEKKVYVSVSTLVNSGAADIVLAGFTAMP